MSSPDQPLDSLRRQIDAIDVALHDLIMKRGTIVEDIRKIKRQGGPALRPGREATILRRLAAEHGGSYPLPALISLWREMICGFTHMQEPLSAAVCGQPGSEQLVRLARDHYGSMTPLQMLASPSACVRAVVDGTAQVAVVPLPAEGEQMPWWPVLMADDAKAPQVVSRLPFVSDDHAEQAWVVAPWPRDISESEASLIGLRLGERTSRSRILGALAAAGFTQAVPVASAEFGSDDCFHVIEVDGAVAKSDARLAAVDAELGGTMAETHVIGGYARPLVLPPAA